LPKKTKISVFHHFLIIQELSHPHAREAKNIENRCVVEMVEGKATEPNH